MGSRENVRKWGGLGVGGCSAWKHETVIITHTHTDDGHNYYHATCVNSRQVTAAQQAISTPHCHRRLVPNSPDMPKHNYLGPIESISIAWYLFVSVCVLFQVQENDSFSSSWWGSLTVESPKHWWIMVTQCIWGLGVKGAVAGIALSVLNVSAITSPLRVAKER